MTDTVADTPLLVLPFRDIEPDFAKPPRHAGRMSAILGRVTMGAGAWVGDDTIIRADGHFVRIGDDFQLGSGSTVHIAHDVYPTKIGDRVVVGRNSVIHACTVGADCVIGDNVVILDGSVVEAGSILNNSLVYPRTHLPGGQLYAGRPAKPVRPLRDGEIEERAKRLRASEETEPPLRQEWSGAREHRGDVVDDVFIAATARVRGKVNLAPSSSIWFACDVDGGAHGVTVGQGANIQDNTIIRCERMPFVLSAGSVIGHNVKLGGCTIAEASLVGMGSTIAEGTIVDRDVLVAAGTETTPGQHLETGWLWGGSPARPLSKMNEGRRGLIATTVETYMQYAATFAEAQRRLVRRSA